MLIIAYDPKTYLISEQPTLLIRTAVKFLFVDMKLIMYMLNIKSIFFYNEISIIYYPHKRCILMIERDKNY
jgi:hypothetical protein